MSESIAPQQRLYGHLSFINDLLLIPMFTVVVLEISHHSVAENLGGYSPLYLWFCGSFALEWAWGLALSSDRKGYLRSWEKGIDLFTAIPFGVVFQGMRFARVVRILRVVRLLLRARRFRGKGKKLLRVIGVVTATVFAGALGLMIVEPETVTNLDDALWWSMITISTVGYGDFTPTTGAGRIVASALVLSGIGVFGFVAGFMASLMDAPEEDAIRATLSRLEAKIDALGIPEGDGN